MPREIEVGDIVSTNHGFKMVVEIYPGIYEPHELCLSCVDADDNTDVGDAWMTPRLYHKSTVVPVFSTDDL